MPPLPSQETHQALVRDGIINGEHSTVPSATWRGLCGGWTKMDQDGNQLYWAKGRIVKIQFSVFSFAHFDAFHIFKAQLYCRGTPGWTAMALHLHNLFSPDFQVEVGSLSKSCKKSADGIYKILYLQYIRCIYIYIIIYHHHSTALGESPRPPPTWMPWTEHWRNFSVGCWR